MQGKNIKVNIPKVTGEIRDVEAANNDLSLKTLNLNLSSNSAVMDELLDIFAECISVLSSYRSLMNRDIEKTKSAVETMERSDENIGASIR